MNKLTKVGVSALCGSLAAVSAANAGSMAVGGTATATWVTQNYGDVGNPLGMATWLTFVGSGELDNGSTFSSTVALDDKSAFSSANISLTTPSLGTFKLGQGGGGGGIGGYDDNMPYAYEETWGTNVTVGADLAKGVGSSTYLQWTSPSVAGSKVILAYAGKADGVQVNDKAGSGGTTAGLNHGVDIVLDIADPNGHVNVFAGYSAIERDKSTVSTLEDHPNDLEAGTAGVTLTIGPVKAGFQRTAEFFGTATTADTEYYANTSWGVSFNVNDDLSVSYSEFWSTKGFNGSDLANRRVEADSMQLAYSMGGASIKIAQTDVDNAQYVTGSTQDYEGTTVALSLAF